MIQDKLYELAFQYKKTKLWERMCDTEVFAVKLSDNRIGYISIMGFAREHCAIALYIGEDGINSFREISRADESRMSYFEFQDAILKQNCLQCAFEGKDALTKEERESAKKFAREHGIRIAGKNAYPQFIKFRPNRLWWPLQTDQEQEDLCEALKAAIELAGLLKEKRPSELGLGLMNEDTTEVPMLVCREGRYDLEQTTLPEEKPKVWPEPKLTNDIAIANLKKADRMGVWECGIIRFPEPLQGEEDEVPYFPVILMIVERTANYVLPVLPALCYEDEPEELLNQFMETLLEQNVCPEEMIVRDERTYTFAKDFCDRLKIKLRIGEELPALDETEQSFLDHLCIGETDGVDRMTDLIYELLDMDEEEINNLPEELFELVKYVVGQGVLPKELEKDIKRRFLIKDSEQKQKKRSNKTESKSSYVISVSLGSGCYRHIQISGSSTLLQLHGAILEAFGFDDDHAHAFFMDNRAWSEQDCYYMQGVESGYRTTHKYCLEQVGLCQGMQFKYIFDFGDEWTFQCKVLRVLEEGTKEPVVIRSKGDAPKQYEEWDE